MRVKQTTLDCYVNINPEGITKSYPHDLIEYVDISSVGTGCMVESPKSLDLSQAPSRAKRIVRNGDTILATVRPNLRSFLYITQANSNTIASTGFAVLRAKSNADSRFVYYAITDPRFTGYLTNNTKGTSYPAVDSDTILRGEVPVFPLEQQKRIASILSAYDDLIENNRRRIQLLEQAARLLYKEWFVHLRFPGHEHTQIIDGVPEGWEKKTIADFFDTTSGGTPSRKTPEFFTGDINWVKTQELNEDFIFETEEKITEEALKKSAAKLFPENTLLVSIYGGTNIGRTGILAQPAASNQACVALFPKHPSANHIYAQLYFQHIREHLIGIAQGAAQTNISQDTLRKVPMLIPPESLMLHFLQSVSASYEQLKNLTRQNASLAKARDLLLPKLMNGEVAV